MTIDKKALQLNAAKALGLERPIYDDNNNVVIYYGGVFKPLCPSPAGKACCFDMEEALGINIYHGRDCVQAYATPDRDTIIVVENLSSFKTPTEARQMAATRYAAEKGKKL